MTSWDIMTELYSSRWSGHPANKSRQSEIEFQLDSLLHSGDLEGDRITYKATPKSMVTLDQADEQDRRHREASRLQRWIVYLTFVIAVAALQQAGLLSSAIKWFPKHLLV